MVKEAVYLSEALLAQLYEKKMHTNCPADYPPSLRSFHCSFYGYSLQTTPTAVFLGIWFAIDFVVMVTAKLHCSRQGWDKVIKWIPNILGHCEGRCSPYRPAEVSLNQI